MNGNWSQLEMTTQLGASATQVSLALAAFWAMVTVGRVLFAAVGHWLPVRVTYHILPLTISFGEEDLTAIAAAMAGSVIAFYQLGYGTAAFGVGPLQDAGTSLARRHPRPLRSDAP
jgi:hypothetical protein